MDFYASPQNDTYQLKIHVLSGHIVHQQLYNPEYNSTNLIHVNVIYGASN